MNALNSCERQVELQFGNSLSDDWMKVNEA
jgi:hypothetical protein